jgi:hypothetical protein
VEESNRSLKRPRAAFETPPRQVTKPRDPPNTKDSGITNFSGSSTESKREDGSIMLIKSCIRDILDLLGSEFSFLHWDNFKARASLYQV